MSNDQIPNPFAAGQEQPGGWGDLTYSLTDEGRQALERMHADGIERAAKIAQLLRQNEELMVELGNERQKHKELRDRYTALDTAIERWASSTTLDDEAVSEILIGFGWEDSRIDALMHPTITVEVEFTVHLPIEGLSRQKARELTDHSDLAYEELQGVREHEDALRRLGAEQVADGQYYVKDAWYD